MQQKNLVFIGDSLIEFFDWQKRFPEHVVANFGSAGETVEGLLYRSVKIVKNLKEPDWLFIMTGTNNLAMDDYAFTPSYTIIVDALISAFPKIQIVITSLLPITLPWLASSAVPRMNAMLMQLAVTKGVHFLDIYSLFLGDHNNPVSHYFLEDGVHLSDQGYAVWSEAVADLIRS